MTDPNAPTPAPYAAIVLAGGAGSRLGGASKPALPVGGRPMLHRVLAAVPDAVPRVVVAPPGLALPPGVTRTLEAPPGGGPVAATAAGLALVPADTAYVALLAADLPLLTTAAVRRLRDAATDPAARPAPDGAVFTDGDGRPQWLCGVWRTRALRDGLAALPGGPAGLPLRQLLGDLPAVRVATADPAPARAPWWDCDTEADLQQARRWAGEEVGMNTLEEWTEQACQALGLDAAGAAAHRDLVLDVAREVAHGVVRPAAPVSTFLLGMAVARGSDPDQAAAALTELAARWDS